MLPHLIIHLLLVILLVFWLIILLFLLIIIFVVLMHLQPLSTNSLSLSMRVFLATPSRKQLYPIG